MPLQRPRCTQNSSGVMNTVSLEWRLGSWGLGCKDGTCTRLDYSLHIQNYYMLSHPPFRWSHALALLIVLFQEWSNYAYIPSVPTFIHIRVHLGSLEDHRHHHRYISSRILKDMKRGKIYIIKLHKKLWYLDLVATQMTESNRVHKCIISLWRRRVGKNGQITLRLIDHTHKCPIH